MNEAKAPNKKRSLLWQLPLTVVFLTFGLLLMAQYHTHSEAGSLENESAADLAMIMKSVNDNKQALENELAMLQAELAENEALVAGGESLVATMNSRIANLSLAIGAEEVFGSGLSITITNESNLMYYDLIDMINELFISGAEVVAINDIRFTSRTAIAEEARYSEVFDETTQKYTSASRYVITVNGEELLFPIIIKAIGDPATLEKGLDYPGGIIESLNTLYGVYPTIRQMEELHIPAAVYATRQYAALPPTEEAAAQ